MQKGKKKSREPIWKLYFNEYAKIWLDTQVKALRPLQYTKPDIAEVENKCLITDISVGLDVKVTKNTTKKVILCITSCNIETSIQDLDVRNYSNSN